MADNSPSILADHGSAAAGNINGSITINNYLRQSGLTDQEIIDLEKHYLKRIMKDCMGLEWLRLVRKQDDNTASQGLQSVYTALMTESYSGHDDQLTEWQNNLNNTKAMDILLQQRGEQKQLSALAVLNQYSKLVLTGDPGSGKSAFVNYLALCMAGQQLNDPYVNLRLLIDPAPDESGNPETEVIEVEGSEENEEREVFQPWDHGVLIPVRVILRDFSASEYFPVANDTADAFHVMQFIEAQLKFADCSEYFDVLKGRLRGGQVLVMFDGLDEVPQAGERRKSLLSCIEGFTRTYSDCRILVTCRPYAYQDKQWRLDDFADTKLAEFSRGQMIHFIWRWYESAPDLEKQSAQQRADKLQQAVLGREALTELAKRPLLLSLIAYLHANRHDLPERRADLYKRLLELLVDEWEKARFKADDAEMARERDQLSLAEFLQIGQDTIRLVLERLAFKAHASQGAERNSTADISAKDLIFELSKAAREKGKRVNEWELCEYLRDRVGILYQRGGESEVDAIYTFPHRSFQEYLAAAYFRRDEDGLFDYFQADFDAVGFALGDESWQCLAAYLGRTDPDCWREVVVLLGGMKSLEEPGPVWEFLEALVEEPGDMDSRKEQVWGLRLAAEILTESLNRENLNRKQSKTFKEIQQALPEILGSTFLVARERAAVGDYLAEIGDPRSEVMMVGTMPFCYVPAGLFIMGEGVEQREYGLDYGYWISQNPVTVAQFAEYVATTAVALALVYARGLCAPANSPIVNVSQREAVKFCDWLTKLWKDFGGLREGWRVMLPNEPEWEKAARGGYKHIDSPLICSMADDLFDQATTEAVRLIENKAKYRNYPWGYDSKPERANYGMKIGRVTTGEVFPSGASPYGCHDLSGNIWEWTRSEYRGNPYPKIGTEEYRERERRNSNFCVLRGGGFSVREDQLKSTYRGASAPAFYDHSIGFRVVISPAYCEKNG